MNKYKKLILMVAMSSIASQIYVNMFVDGFIVALSVVMMGFFLYTFNDIKPTFACLLIGIFSPLFRLIIVIISGMPVVHALKLVLPDMAFFFSYAIIFGVVLKFLSHLSYRNYYIRLAVSDFISNCIEMTTRAIIFNTSISLKEFEALFLLAIGRSFLIVLACALSDLNSSLLIKREHEENYRKLALMAATFKSEVYFMEKNMNEIEDIMSNAFTLYKKLVDAQYPKEFQDISLEIAKDIHEVKKGYKRVIRGIEDNFLSDIDFSSLKLSDILKILATHINYNAKSRGINLSFSYKVYFDYTLNNHFYLMGILRNLVSNSLDILEESQNDNAKINIVCTDILKFDEKFLRILVSDNGPGIDEKIIDVIFDPGFSTKYNKQTGDINRGVGLTLVKDILHEKFHGEVAVASTKSGTTFTIDIPLHDNDNDIF